VHWPKRRRQRAGGAGSGSSLGSRGAPLISENVSTLPSSLAATLLFGNRRNFPNPGMEERPGLIGLAENGTLFLDEIGDMSSEVQPLLLRVMERGGEYLRIGDEAKPRRANVRFIAATNHPERLRPELRRRFPREIHLPGLDARPEDIPLLSRHLFLRQLPGRAELQRFVLHGQLRMDPRLVEQLVRYPYSTHVSELAFLLEQSVHSSPGETLLPLGDAELRLRSPAPASPHQGPLPASLSEHRAPSPLPARSAALPGAQEAQQALDAASGSVVRAAQQLGINRHQLHRLIRRHSLVLSRGSEK
jgi:two-component system nitrogen regulation response regulator GlnG/two-component system response regulator HydG